MNTSVLFNNSVAYIENESAHHGWKNIFVIWEIQRLQIKLLWLNQIYDLSQDVYSKEEKKLHNIQTKDITNTIAQLQKTYWLSDEQLQKIERKHASVKFWN